MFEVPERSYRVTVDFTTDPQRVEELIGVVFENIERVRTSGPSDLTVALVRESEMRDREESLATNGFWLGVLERIAKLPDYDPQEVVQFRAQFGALNAADVRAFAEEQLRSDR